jgi:hypothetical protein
LALCCAEPVEPYPGLQADLGAFLSIWPFLAISIVFAFGAIILAYFADHPPPDE